VADEVVIFIQEIVVCPAGPAGAPIRPPILGKIFISFAEYRRRFEYEASEKATILSGAYSITYHGRVIMLRSFSFLVAIGLLIFSPLASAASVNVACSTAPVLTTSIAISTQGTVSTISVMHHHGTQFMPISSGILTPNDLPALAEKANVLASLGSSYSLTVDASKCVRDAANLIDCYGPLDQNIGGHKITWYYLFSSEIHTATALADPSKTTRLNMDLVVDGQDYEFAIDYDSSGCIDTHSVNQVIAP
jgi:hypothetical protein